MSPLLPQSVWWHITNFGDSAVTLPLALLTIASLALAGRRHAALSLLLAVGGTGLTMLALKLAFLSCLNSLDGGMIRSPSGHAAMSAVVYGSLALLLTAGSPRRPLLLAATALFVGAIAVSRFAIEAHSRAEILVGLAIGLGFVLLLARRLRHEPPFRPQRRPLILVIAVTLAATYGFHAPAEQAIQRLSQILHDRLPACGQEAR